LIVQHDPGHELADLMRTLPPSGPPGDIEVEPPRIDWGKVAFSCLLSMLPLGTLGSVALTLATSISEQASAAGGGRQRRQQPSRPDSWTAAARTPVQGKGT